MIYSQLRNFVFLKTRKTAGTSVELALRPVCGETDIITAILPKEEWKLASRPPQNHFYDRRREHWRMSRRLWWMLGCRHPKYAPLETIHSHCRASDVRAHIGAEAFDKAFRFSIERNPWDRQVSLYYWRNRKPENRPPFDVWLREESSSKVLDNWQIYTIDDRVVADRVLRFENLAEDLKRLASDLDLPMAPLPHAKVGHRPKAHYRTMYTPETRDLVANWYRREIESFGYDF
ncbi:MAG: hypothetical protein K0R27_2519 [Xanthobacteraceae bacterium]|nr:hypothetical protein [Xanthobacteraceae bacterium]